MKTFFRIHWHTLKVWLCLNWSDSTFENEKWTTWPLPPLPLNYQWEKYHFPTQTPIYFRTEDFYLCYHCVFWHAPLKKKVAFSYPLQKCTLWSPTCSQWKKPKPLSCVRVDRKLETVLFYSTADTKPDFFTAQK